MILAALALLAISLVVLDTCRRLGCRPWASHLALLTGVFGTGLFHYGTHENSFTHVYSALGLILLIWWVVRARARGEGPPGFPVGLTVFFLVLLRATNGVALGVLATTYVFLGARRSTLVAAATGAVLAAVIQVSYNVYASGTLVLSSYGDAGFILSRPMHLSVLLSYERGLFVYYPVLAIMLLSGAIVARTRTIAIGLMALFGLFILIYGFWRFWHLGGGFGHRGFVELVPPTIVLFAAALSALPSRVRGLAAATACLCAFVTLELMLGYWRWSLPCIGSARSVYWSHVVGRESLPPSLLRVLGL